MGGHPGELQGWVYAPSALYWVRSEWEILESCLVHLVLFGCGSRLRTGCVLEFGRCCWVGGGPGSCCKSVDIVLVVSSISEVVARAKRTQHRQRPTAREDTSLS